MNLLYNTNFKFPNEDQLKRNPDLFMDSATSEQDDHNSGLVRYSSAPSSFIGGLLNATEAFQMSNNGGFSRSSSPEVETIVSRFMASCNEDLGSVKQETEESVRRKNEFFRRSEGQIGRSKELQLGLKNGSNIFRQNSSPAGFFSNLTAENATRDGEKFGSCNGKNADCFLSSSKISTQINFYGQSSSSSHMPSIAEECFKTSINSWDNAAIRDLKRGRDNNGHSFSTTIGFETPNCESQNRVNGLTHHLSLPETYSDEAPTERFLTFKEPIPHQVRARRGFATHPRSIAERMRRGRINERIRKLQELFPQIDKQTSTADMLDSAVDQIKALQRQVKRLNDLKAKCKCSSK